MDSIKSERSSVTDLTDKEDDILKLYLYQWYSKTNRSSNADIEHIINTKSGQIYI